METNTNLKLYINNCHDIYLVTEMLASCVAKRLKNNQPVTIEYLSNCATMMKIIRMAKNVIKEYNEELPTKEECDKVAKLHAEYIINDIAPYM